MTPDDITNAITVLNGLIGVNNNTNSALGIGIEALQAQLALQAQVDTLTTEGADKDTLIAGLQSQVTDLNATPVTLDTLQTVAPVITPPTLDTPA